MGAQASSNTNACSRNPPHVKVLGALLDRIAASGAAHFYPCSSSSARRRRGSYPSRWKATPSHSISTPDNASVLALLDELDAIVADFGRQDLSGEGCTRLAKMIERGYPNLARFKSIRAKVDPELRFASRLNHKDWAYKQT